MFGDIGTISDSITVLSSEVALPRWHFTDQFGSAAGLGMDAHMSLKQTGSIAHAAQPHALSPFLLDHETDAIVDHAQFATAVQMPADDNLRRPRMVDRVAHRLLGDAVKLDRGLRSDDGVRVLGAAFTPNPKQGSGVAGQRVQGIPALSLAGKD